MFDRSGGAFLERTDQLLTEEEEAMATRAVDAPSSTDYTEVRGVGWLSFAAVMLGLAGTWNLIDGLLAVGKSKVYGVNHTYVFSDLRTWGWIITILGALQLLAAFAIFAGSELARWFGIVAAGVSAIGQLGFVPAYPFWALAIFTIDILIIYALAVYAGKKLREE
jgi:hypothetical protein